MCTLQVLFILDDMTKHCLADSSVQCFLDHVWYALLIRLYEENQIEILQMKINRAGLAIANNMINQKLHLYV